MFSFLSIAFLIITVITSFFSLLPKPDTSTIKTIIYSNGYSPNKTTLIVGDTIVFENHSQIDFWPASNIHPTHGIYPEFDPQTPIPPGKSWQFTFDKPGTWRFHDHLSPQHTGVIAVLSTKDTTKNEGQKKLLTPIDQTKIILAKTYYLLNKKQLKTDFQTVNILDASDNYHQTLASWIKIVGPKTVMEKLLLDAGNGAETDCHQQAHNVGRLSYQVLGKEAFVKGNSNCHSGYYHGMIEQYFNEEGTENLPEKVSNLCTTFPTEFGQFECLHGIGHGIMAYLDYDLPKAITECKGLETDFQKQSCYGGVFMENIVTGEGKGAKNGHATKWLNDDPQFPCNAVEKSYPIQSQCYLIQTARMLDLHEYDFAKVTPLCLAAPPDMQRICYQSLGRDAAGQVLRNPQKIIEICNKVPSEFKNDCSRGGLYVILEFWGEKMTNQGSEFCNSLTNEQEKAICYQTFINRLPDFFTADDPQLKKICQYVDQKYQQVCLGDRSHN